jgi:hypothetical protein
VPKLTRFKLDARLWSGHLPRYYTVVWQL